MQISKNQIKLMQLASQGLLSSLPKAAEKSDVLRTIQKIALLQIDTINVVARSPYFTIWSRIGNFPKLWLDQSHAEGHLFEYWAHAACFIPIEQYPLFRPDMEEGRSGWKNAKIWRENHSEIVNLVLEKIKTSGPTKSADFERKDIKTSGWWDWKEEKVALEYLWTHGELMIAYRNNFQRFYDFTDKVFPDFNKNQISIEESNKEKIEQTIRVLGATRLKWIADYYRLKKTSIIRYIDELLQSKTIFSIKSSDWDEEIYIHISQQELLENTLTGNLIPTKSTLLNPFDPLIWDRQRTHEIFNFDYTIECYLPSNKRKFGYFCLPILYKGNLVGRIDAKANRKDKVFEIKTFHLEPEFDPNENFFSDLSAAVQSCAFWHETPNVSFHDHIPIFIKTNIESFLLN